MKSIILWVLKMILGNVIDSWEKKARRAAESKAEATKGYAESLEKGKNLEMDLLKQNQQTEETFKTEAENRSDDDVFGVEAFNRS